MMPMIARIAIQSEHSCAAFRKSGIQNRIKPYTPIFEITAATTRRSISAAFNSPVAMFSHAKWMRLKPCALHTTYAAAFHFAPTAEG